MDRDPMSGNSELPGQQHDPSGLRPERLNLLVQRSCQKALIIFAMRSEKHYPRVLSIAGSDSGGGAGIQADLKTFSALGCYGMTAITAITAQNTQGVRAIHGVPLEILTAQIDSVVEEYWRGCRQDRHAARARGGASGGAGNTAPCHATCGARPGDGGYQRGQTDHCADCRGAGAGTLFPLSALLTPNLDEAELLLGRKITHKAELEPAAIALLALGAPAVLLKGGHLCGPEVVDVLVQPGVKPVHLSSPRIESRNVHGTGCTLSSAIASYLAMGTDMTQAVRSARAYILAAIEAGAAVRTGQGHGSAQPWLCAAGHENSVLAKCPQNSLLCLARFRGGCLPSIAWAGLPASLREHYLNQVHKGFSQPPVRTRQVTPPAKVSLGHSDILVTRT